MINPVTVAVLAGSCIGYKFTVSLPPFGKGTVFVKKIWHFCATEFTYDWFGHEAVNVPSEIVLEFKIYQQV